MCKLLVAILMVLVVLSGPAWAGSGRIISYQGNSSGPITGSLNVINTRGTNIYNITLVDYSGVATLSIYDANALQSGSLVSNETIIYELECPAAGYTTSVDFSTAPLQTYSGLVASVSNGVGYINKE